MIGVKKSVGSMIMGVKKNVPLRSLAHKTYGIVKPIVQPIIKLLTGNSKNGIENESNSKEVAREPMRGGIYKAPQKPMRIEKPTKETGEKSNSFTH